MDRFVFLSAILLLTKTCPTYSSFYMYDVGTMKDMTNFFHFSDCKVASTTVRVDESSGRSLVNVNSAIPFSSVLLRTDDTFKGCWFRFDQTAVGGVKNIKSQLEGHDHSANFYSLAAALGPNVQTDDLVPVEDFLKIPKKASVALGFLEQVGKRGAPAAYTKEQLDELKAAVEANNETVKAVLLEATFLGNTYKEVDNFRFTDYFPGKDIYIYSLPGKRKINYIEVKRTIKEVLAQKSRKAQLFIKRVDAVDRIFSVPYIAWRWSVSHEKSQNLHYGKLIDHIRKGVNVFRLNVYSVACVGGQEMFVLKKTDCNALMNNRNKDTEFLGYLNQVLDESIIAVFKLQNLDKMQALLDTVNQMPFYEVSIFKGPNAKSNSLSFHLSQFEDDVKRKLKIVYSFIERSGKDEYTKQMVTPIEEALDSEYAKDIRFGIRIDLAFLKDGIVFADLMAKKNLIWVFLTADYVKVTEQNVREIMKETVVFKDKIVILMMVKKMRDIVYNDGGDGMDSIRPATTTTVAPQTARTANIWNDKSGQTITIPTATILILIVSIGILVCF